MASRTALEFLTAIRNKIHFSSLTPKPLLWLLALASRGWNHPQRPRAILAGVSIGSSSAVYGDLNGLSAYAGAGGFDTRGTRRGQINRYIRGNEDNNWRKS